jgi:small-conductance mechanosensitive channel
MSWSQVQSFFVDNGTLLYIVGVLTVGAWTLMRFVVGVARARRQRSKQLERRRVLDPIETESPFGKPLEVAQDRGLESIEHSATVTRRLVVPLIVVLTAGLACLPLLSSVPATAVSAVVALVTVVLGVAARPLIENAMSGLVVSYSNLIRIGDTVRVEDMYGTVEDITMTHTTIKLWDWRRLIVPNAKMLQQSFYNYSVFDKYQWAYVEFWVAYDADLAEVEELARQAAKASKYFADYEPPHLWISGLDREGINCWLAGWADSPSDAWYLRHEMRLNLAKALRERGINVHMHNVEMRQAA